MYHSSIMRRDFLENFHSTFLIYKLVNLRIVTYSMYAKCKAEGSTQSAHFNILLFGNEKPIFLPWLQPIWRDLFLYSSIYKLVDLNILLIGDVKPIFLSWLQAFWRDLYHTVRDINW